ncbi:SPW repeat protein [Paenibacillus sp. N3.4]|uniref:SPW repeat domain-containing protein n=1 Tax=Paenibacillus sp. N3.4 TaxID=2603222 RepID=UPI0011C98632|nr:SPW repeat protein [Paenibacillus sp. N3.4]TXK77968.1 hypothetical protein FU659_21505 [Paenibacillus sp. N3.4]
MYLKNLMSAGMGIWFLVSPWVFDFTDHMNAFLVCALLGSLQVVLSLLALGKTGKKVWENWICFFTGAVFLVLPNLYGLHLMAFFSFVVLGFMTMLVNYANLYDDFQ